MRAMRCMSCQPSFIDTETRHCFGTGDTPSIDGLIGSGNRCSCDCRTNPPSEGAVFDHDALAAQT